MSKAPICPYCNEQSKLTTGKEIYPHRDDLHSKYFYLCKPCAAWCGCHPQTKQPLGRLANAELRRAKIAAHAAFDPIWRRKRELRNNAYAWLSSELGVPLHQCHIGMFDVDMCRRVIEVCRVAETPKPTL